MFSDQQGYSEFHDCLTFVADEETNDKTNDLVKRGDWAMVTALAAPWDTSAPSGVNPTTSRIGNAFLDDYLLPFELASVVLIAALIGAVVIARKEGDEKEEP